MSFTKIIQYPLSSIKRTILRLYKNYQIRALSSYERNECKEILNTINGRSVLSSNQITQVRQYYRQYIHKNIPTEWHQLYLSANNNFDARYIPLDLLFTRIIPFLNNKFIEAYADKSRYEDLFPNITHPITILKKINGSYYVNNKIVATSEIDRFLPKNGVFIIKPTMDTSRGGGVELINFNDYTSNQMMTKLKDRGDNYIIQEKVESHPVINALNPTSLNTIRIITYRKENQVYILSSTLKIGKDGEIVDNGHHGGFFCGITEDGKLRKYLYTLNPFSKRIATENGIKIEGIQLPNFENLKDAVKECALKLPYARYVGWDIAINKEGKPVLIEINLKCPGGNIMQIPNGPLFGDHTGEILEEISKI